MRLCKLLDCSNKYHAKGYCKKHYRQFNRWGSLTPPKRPTHHHLFPTWNAMIQRCHNPKSPNYMNYGGRGIVVCERWLASRGAGFWSFIADMGERPTIKHSIDRIDNNRGYSPDNCRWATMKEQANNRRIPVCDFSMIDEDFSAI